jgi:ATP-GRASP peptide maturase of grasp-with-spasm system
MILIFSTDSQELSTEEVMDWLEEIGVAAVRVNGEDVVGIVGNGFLSASPGKGFDLRLGDEAPSLTLENVSAVWFRRWIHQRKYEEALVTQDGAPVPVNIKHRLDIARHLSLELKRLTEHLFSRLRRARWLTHPGQADLNKLHVLETAARCGLAIPETLVTTSRQELERFARAHGRIITKSISDSPLFFSPDEVHLLLTAEIGPDEIAAVPATIFPSLFQERLEKEYELRIFFLAGEMYPMAIFSQGDEQTRGDFRHYNYARPNRNVPYRLPEEIADRLRALMEELGLETGSIDMVKTVDGRHVFLEVNPVGQFGMVSQPCNYHLEEKVAAWLASRGPA